MKLILATILLCSACAKENMHLVNSTPASSNTNCPISAIEQLTDPDVHLFITNWSSYGESITNLCYGDSSMYNRFLVYRNIPKVFNSLGGILLNGTDSFMAVNDGFMAGAENFHISFWFSPAVANPTFGTLIGSNWATPNDGDWLLQFMPDGSVQLMLQSPELTQTIQFSNQNFNPDSKYYVQIIKQGVDLYFIVDGISTEYKIISSLKFPENGSPLVFGANAYDRLEGMDYFNGSIGDIVITITN